MYIIMYIETHTNICIQCTNYKEIEKDLCYFTYKVPSAGYDEQQACINIYMWPHIVANICIYM